MDEDLILEISIHALLAESDFVQIIMSGYASISIHALLAESDRQNPGEHYVAFRFLSTLSLRRATADNKEKLTGLRRFLSTLSLRRATPKQIRERKERKNFYPRSPCGERPPVRDVIQWEGIFLSTLSLRRATINTYHRIFGEGISIHALLAESDASQGA